jgi:hypothetical protein
VPEAVYLTADLNAGIRQHPRLGIPWRFHNCLSVGLPCLDALSPEQFRAVVAHEIGHFSGNHGRFSGWIYRTRSAWSRLYAVTPELRRGSDLLWGHLMRWYVPVFAGYSYVLSRANENEADRCAVEEVGLETAVSALVIQELRDRLLSSEFWPAVWRQVQSEAVPPRDIPARLREAVCGRLSEAWAVRTLGQLLKGRTGLNDTHPCLPDRLRVLGVAASDARALLARALAGGSDQPQRSAAEALLGERREHYASLFGKTWRALVIDTWRRQHDLAVKARDRLRQLEEREASGSLTVDEAWERTQALTVHAPTAEAIPRLEAFVTANPGHGKANLALGMRLADDGDDACLGPLRTAMGCGSDLILPAFERIQSYLESWHREEELAAYREQMRLFCREFELAQRERQHIGPKDRFEPHGFTAAQVAAIGETLASVSPVMAAYVVRKVVAHLTDQPCCVVAVVPRFRLVEDEVANRLLRQHLCRVLRIEAPFTVVVLAGALSPLRRRLRQVPGSLVFERGTDRTA